MNFVKLEFLIRRTAFWNLDYHLPPTQAPYHILCLLLWNYIRNHTRGRDHSSIHRGITNNKMEKRTVANCLVFLQFLVFKQTAKNTLCKIILLFRARRIRRSLDRFHIYGSTLYFACWLLLRIGSSSFRLRIASLAKLLITPLKSGFTSPFRLLCCSSIWLRAHLWICFQCSVLIHFSSVSDGSVFTTYGHPQNQLPYPL